MNIHFNNKKLFASLNAQTIAKIKVGSHMYGLNNTSSDEDFLSIYSEPKSNRNSFMWEHHQLQYKENNVDYNFTNLQTFIRNALTGDATINFEVLFSDGLIQTDLQWLYSFRNHFINYNIIKSYLGLAKRDLKYWKKDTSNMRNHTSETNKKLSHFVRGIIFANMLIKGSFTMDLINTKTYSKFNYSDLELLDRIKHGTLDYSFNMIVDFFEKQMHFLRVENNTNLENKKIPLYMDTKILKQLDNEVINFTNKFRDKVDKVDYGELYYDALENGLHY